MNLFIRLHCPKLEMFVVRVALFVLGVLLVLVSAGLVEEKRVFSSGEIPSLFNGQ